MITTQIHYMDWVGLMPKVIVKNKIDAKVAEAAHKALEAACESEEKGAEFWKTIAGLPSSTASQVPSAEVYRVHTALFSFASTLATSPVIIKVKEQLKGWAQDAKSSVDSALKVELQRLDAKKGKGYKAGSKKDKETLAIIATHNAEVASAIERIKLYQDLFAVYIHIYVSINSVLFCCVHLCTLLFFVDLV